MTRKDDSIWETPGLLKTLREMCETRLFSAAQIAQRLSVLYRIDLTRNAIIGKVDRMGYPTRGRKKSTIAHAPRPKRVKGTEALPAPEIAPEEPTPQGDVPKGCRFMHGDAMDRNFCGAPTTAQGASWCAYHAKIVWNPQSPSKARKAHKFYMRAA